MQSMPRKECTDYLQPCVGPIGFSVATSWCDSALSSVPIKWGPPTPSTPSWYCMQTSSHTCTAGRRRTPLIEISIFELGKAKNETSLSKLRDYEESLIGAPRTDKRVEGPNRSDRGGIEITDPHKPLQASILPQNSDAFALLPELPHQRPAAPITNPSVPSRCR